MTFNGKDYLCNRCLEAESSAKGAVGAKSPTKGSAKGGMVGAPTQNGHKGGYKNGMPVTSTPARAEQVVLDGTLSSPASDRSDISSESKSSAFTLFHEPYIWSLTKCSSFEAVFYCCPGTCEWYVLLESRKSLVYPVGYYLVITSLV